MFSLGNFFCSIFKFTFFSVVSILLLSSLNEFSFKLLHFSFLEVPLFLFYIFYFFVETLIFADPFYFICFTHVCNCSLKHFYDCIFKIIVQYFQHLCHLSVEIEFCSAHSNCDFPWSWDDVWLFSLCPEYFEYCVIRLWILYLLFLQVSSNTVLQWQGKLVLFHYARWE